MEVAYGVPKDTLSRKGQESGLSLTPTGNSSERVPRNPGSPLASETPEKSPVEKSLFERFSLR